MPNGMLTFSAIFPIGEDLGSNLCHEAKHLCLCITLVMNNMHIYFYLNENLSKFQKKIAPKT